MENIYTPLKEGEPHEVVAEKANNLQSAVFKDIIRKLAGREKWDRK